jgi:hypothetical protein
MVERFNGWIEEVLQSHHVRSGEDLVTTLHRTVRLTNQQMPQSALGQHVALAGDEGLAQTQAAAVQGNSHTTFRDVTPMATLLPQARQRKTSGFCGSLTFRMIA